MKGTGSFGSYGPNYILDISSISFGCTELKSVARSYNSLLVVLACGMAVLMMNVVYHFRSSQIVLHRYKVLQVV